MGGVYLEPVAATLSRKTGQPVKLAMTRTEVFEGTGPTSATHIRVKMGASKEGRLTAEAKLKAQGIAQEGRAKLNEEIAAERVKLDHELAAKSKEAEARIDEAKASALKEVNTVAADVAADIVQRLIGVAPSGSELAKAVEAARKE